MNVLAHLCCGPCSPHVFSRLREEGHQVTALFYNPNVQPYTENRARAESAERYCVDRGIEFIFIDEYDVFDFVRKAIEKMDRGEDRCEYCYRLRLRGAAGAAKEYGFDAFTSTLLASPYQKHELARTIGEQAGEEMGVQFLYMDFREGWKESRKVTFESEMYRQKYCGCIFSEQERWLGDGRKDEDRGKGGR
jgi:predicted adenine nucleotide alpha hydrolase (AANH) superfamily ATPase